MVNKKKILVIGDVMLDTYYSGDVKRISPEAPVPVFCKRNERSVPGGAANVAANLVAAEQSVSIMSVIGFDSAGDKLIEAFEKYLINTELVFRTQRTTTEKIRLLALNNQQVLRLDNEDTTALSGQECSLLLNRLKNCIDNFELILLSDYLKGLFTFDFTQGILQLAKEHRIPVIIDVKDKKAEKYQNAYLLKPNIEELINLTGMTVKDDAEIIAASEYLRNKCNCKYVLTTCGARGMVLIGAGKPYFIDAIGEEVFDVTGAGDTTIAYLAACMVNGMDIKKSVRIANAAAGAQIKKVGTSSVCWNEVKSYLTVQGKETNHKILSFKEIENFRREHANKKIVFTNGCFDIMHVGHIRYLQEAARLGDILIVGLNSDDSVKRLKGAERPVNSEPDRAEMMCALGVIDYVAIFEEDTPLELIKKIQPDILVKGGDYSGEYIVGTNEVEARGGKLVLIPFVEGKSTSNIIKKIKMSND